MVISLAQVISKGLSTYRVNDSKSSDNSGMVMNWKKEYLLIPIVFIIVLSIGVSTLTYSENNWYSWLTYKADYKRTAKTPLEIDASIDKIDLIRLRDRPISTILTIKLGTNSLMIVTEGKYLTAFNLKSKKPLWSIESPATYPSLEIINGRITIVAYSQSYVMAVDAIEGKVLWKYDKVYLPAGCLSLVKYSVFLDVNRDGILDIAFINYMDSQGQIQIKAYITVIDGSTGKLLQSINLDSGAMGSPAVGDVTGDGIEDLVVPVAGSIKIFTIDKIRGKLVLIHEYKDVYANTVSLADINGDNILDIIAEHHSMGNPYRITVISPRKGGILWSYTYGNNVPLASSPAIGDIDGDGTADIVFTVFQEYRMNNKAYGAIVAISGASHKYIFNPIVMPADLASLDLYPVLLNADGDKQLEIVVTFSDKLLILDNDGSELYVKKDIAITNTVVADDIDNDHRAEILIPIENNDEFYVMVLGASKAQVSTITITKTTTETITVTKTITSHNTITNIGNADTTTITVTQTVTEIQNSSITIPTTITKTSIITSVTTKPLVITTTETKTQILTTTITRTSYIKSGSEEGGTIRFINPLTSIAENVTNSKFMGIILLAISLGAISYAIDKLFSK